MNSNSRFEIIIDINGEKYYVDTYDITSAPLNYQISDINDIASRRASSSLSITLPETSQNRYIFNSISDLSVDLTYFDPNKKAPVQILVDSIVVFNGSLQLTDVNVNLDTNETQYTTVVYSESDTFFKAIGDDMLGGYPTTSTLDFSELNHTWGTASITGSWTQSWGYGYFYPLVDTTGEWSLNRINASPTGSMGGANVGTISSVKVTDFYPATYVKYIWKKIFDSVGFKWKSNFLDNSETFNNLLLPFSQNIMNQSLNYAQSLQFVADASTYSVMSGSYSYLAQGNPSQYSIGGPGNYFAKILPFNEDVTDPYGYWDATTYTYNRGTASGQFKQRFGFSGVRIYYDYIRPYQSPTWIAREFIAVIGVRSKFPTGYQGRTPGSDVPGWTTNPTIQQLFLYPRIPMPGGTNFAIVKNNGYQGYTNWVNRVDGSDSPLGSPKPYTQFDLWTDYLDSGNTSNSSGPNNLYFEPLYPGEQVRFFAIHFTTDSASISGYYPNMYLGQGSIIKNQVDPQLIPNQQINYNSVLPSNLKQKDFLTSIIKMFNLYIEPSKEDPNTLIIEPRDEYYDAGAFKDWSSKLDISSPIKQQILAETQNRATLFTYKKDSDFWNTDYSDKLKREYGDIRYVLDNDFIDGEKKIDTVFSPTPLQLLDGSKGIVLPIIFKKNNGKQLQKADSFNFRILLKNNNGLINLGSTDRWTFENGSYQYYPYAGHFDNPYTPTVDINWGQSYLYYQNTPTNNNLFNLHWKNTMDELYNINSRVVTAKFYLTPEDIYQFRFNDNIYVIIDGVGGYYKVNKIINFDPSDIRTTEVELLKTINITIPNDLTTNQPDTEEILLPGSANISQYINTVATSMRQNKTDGSLAFINGINNTVGGGYNTTQGNNNANNSCSSIVSGFGNSLIGGSSKLVVGGYNYDNSTNNSIIFGNNNNLYGFGYSNLVIGNFNTASGTSSIILGSGNNLGTFSGVVVIGNGLSASQDNITYINNNTIVVGGSGSNVIISGSVSQDNIKVGVNEIAFGDSNGGLTSSYGFQFNNGNIINAYGGSFPIVTSTYSSVISSQAGNIYNSYYSSIISSAGDSISNSKWSTIIGNAGGLISYSLRSNIIGGGGNGMNYNNNSTIIGGDSNILNSSKDSSIIGGNNNSIGSTYYSSILGGKTNSIYTANRNYNSILGGYVNRLHQTEYSIIGGGSNNIMKSNYSGTGINFGRFSKNNLISNGKNNIILGYGQGTVESSSIIGGQNNYIFNRSLTSVNINNSIIVGGEAGLLKTDKASVNIDNSILLGGYNNIIIASYSTVDSSSIIGGKNNLLSSSTASVIIGGQNLELSNVSDTVLVPQLKIDSVTQSSATSSKILIWDDDKLIKYVESTTFDGGGVGSTVSNNYNYNSLSYSGSYQYSIIGGTIGFNQNKLVYFSSLPANAGDIKDFEITIMMDYIGFTLDPNYTTTYKLYGTVMKSAFSVSSYGITSSFDGKAGAAFSTSVTATDIQFDGTAIYTLLSYPSAASPGTPPNANFLMVINTKRNYTI